MPPGCEVSTVSVQHMRSLTMIQRADAPMRPNENQGPVILGATLSVTILAVLTTIVRLYVRIRMIRNIGWDDYTMIISMALCIAGQCVVVPQVYYGAGRHIEYISPADFSMGMKLNFISQPIYLAGICMVKISVGFFLLRIAVRPMFRRLIIGIMIFMGVYTFGCILTVLFQCTNIQLMWDPTAKGTCWTVTQIKILGRLNTVLNMVTDLAFSIGIPIPMLWGVQMNRRHKASLICILGLGAFASAASMVKLSYVGNYGRAGDLMWDSRNLTIWTVQECNVGMVAGNLPCLKPLFRTILSSTYGKGSRKASQPQYLSGSYGAGTKERSTTKSYGPLASPKISDRGFFDGKGGDPLRRGDLGKSYMLTTIDATHGGQANRDADTTTLSGRSSPAASADARSSTESFTRLNHHHTQHDRHNLGNIMVTTEVDVSEWVQGQDQRGGRPQAKEMV